MMFLLRAAFWMSVVLIVLPTGKTTPARDAAEIGAAEAASAATAAVADISNFCARQPGACMTGSQVAVVLGHRMQAGANMIYEFLTERREGPAKQNGAETARIETVASRHPSDRAETTGSVDARSAVKTVPAALLPRPRPRRSHDTLTASDRQPTWRAPALRQEARLRQPG